MRFVGSEPAMWPALSFSNAPICWLDVVEFSGAHERHGPLSATWQAPTALGVDVFTAGPGSPGQRLLAWLRSLLAQ